MRLNGGSWVHFVSFSGKGRGKEGVEEIIELLMENKKEGEGDEEFMRYEACGMMNCELNLRRWDMNFESDPKAN
jgi:hypothetical protein